MPGDTPTILDYLNEDCWRAVLDYVPVEDVIRTQRASRRWQQVVLTYLPGIHFKIECPNITYAKPPPKARILEIGKNRYLSTSFKNWLSKFGQSIVASYCDTVGYLEMLAEYCPNLEDLEFMAFDSFSHQDHTEDFKHLRKLSFLFCMITDEFISQFITREGLEELEINDCDRITGECLMDIKSTKLKSLIIDALDNVHMCNWLIENNHINISELTKFRVANNIHVYFTTIDIKLMLKMMPKVEQLEVCDEGLEGNAFYSSVCGLRHLRHLCTDVEINDSRLEALTRCCQELDTLELMVPGNRSVKGLTRVGISAMCQNAGSRLASFTIRFYPLTDDDILACVRGCPVLKTLNVSSPRTTRELLQRVEDARREMSLRRSLQVCLQLEGSEYEEVFKY